MISKHNIKLILKPKRPIKKIINHCKKIKKISIDKILKNKNITTMGKSFPIHKLLPQVDVVVVNGVTTIEIESAMAGIPLVNVCLVKNSPISGKFYSVEAGAAIGINNIKHLEQAIMDILYGGVTMKKEQHQYIQKLGILNDGKNGQRAHEAILKLIGVK